VSETQQGLEGNLATIIESGSTNTPAYKVVIHKDGSATAEIGGWGAMSHFRIERSQHFPPGTIDTKNAAFPAYRDWRCQQNPDRTLPEIDLLRNDHQDFVCGQDQRRSAKHPAVHIGRRSGATGGHYV